MDKDKKSSEKVEGLLIVPSLDAAVLSEVSGRDFGPNVVYKTYVWNHDFENDSDFPAKNVSFVAMAIGKRVLVEALVSKLCPNLKWLHLFFAGVDSIMCPVLTNSDIQVTNAKGAFSESLAEWTMFGCMYFAKRLSQSRMQHESKIWKKYTVANIRGATLGIIGYGNIGEAVARLAKTGFGMKILAVKRSPSKVTAEAAAVVNELTGLDTVPDVLSRCDYVVGILPGMKSTKHYFGDAEFKAMKSGSVFINIGRGITCDEVALSKALESGHLKGAVLDVFEQEPLPKSSPVWNISTERLLMTPHCADLTPEYWPSTVDGFVEKLKCFETGQEFEYVVNKELGY